MAPAVAPKATKKAKTNASTSSKSSSQSSGSQAAVTDTVVTAKDKSSQWICFPGDETYRMLQKFDQC